jgi:hypothetical protein
MRAAALDSFKFVDHRGDCMDLSSLCNLLLPQAGVPDNLRTYRNTPDPRPVRVEGGEEGKLLYCRSFLKVRSGLMSKSERRLSAPQLGLSCGGGRDD